MRDRAAGLGPRLRGRRGSVETYPVTLVTSIGPTTRWPAVLAPGSGCRRRRLNRPSTTPPHVAGPQDRSGGQSRCALTLGLRFEAQHGCQSVPLG